MSRMMLCGVTAAVLVFVSAGVMIARYQAVGDEVETPTGPNAWKVTLTVHGNADAGARVFTSAPLDFRRQHVLREQSHSNQFEAKPGESKDPRRRSVVWALKPGTKPGPFKLRCEYHCAVEVSQASGSMDAVAQALATPPAPGRYLEIEPKAGPENERLVALGCQLAADHEKLSEQVHAIYDYVSKEIANEPSVEGPRVGSGPIQALTDASGDDAAKARLLTLLLRVNHIPARVVTGVILSRGTRQSAHHWVEAWVHERWVPMCPFNHHYGRVPANYLVFTLGDLSLVRGKQVRDLEHGFLVERVKEGEPVEAKVSWPKKFFRAVSLYMLPPAEQRLVEFLLLLPVAALLVCLFRNVIGLMTFGTFAPALLGMAFRDVASLPGIGVFLSILLVGWMMRRLLDRYHLLQVPRIALLLTLVIMLLIIVIVAANRFSMPATRYISLFPLIILTGMIERFWTLEEEDGTVASFKRLLTTFGVSAVIALVLSLPAVSRHLFRYPETLGLVMAALLLIGRYTGYRLTELFRFRDFLAPPPASRLKVVG
jgi:hypothetical protein